MALALASVLDCSSGRASCFAAGTQVLLAEGTDVERGVYNTRSIEELREGDLVLGADPLTGEIEAKPVVAVMRRMAQDLRRLEVRSADGSVQVLTTTAEHPFAIPDEAVDDQDSVPAGGVGLARVAARRVRFVAANDLPPGVELVPIAGPRPTLAANDLDWHGDLFPVYNLTVAEAHTYFVAAAPGDTPVLAHNAIQCNVSTVSARVQRQIDSILVDGNISDNRGGNFTVWFDTLTPKQLDLLWNSDRMIGSKTLREVIEDRIRHPGELHEWLLAGRANSFKKWGVSMETIKQLRSVIDDLELKLGSEVGHHSGNLGGKFHYELRRLIDDCNDYDEFVFRMQAFAKRWLPNGVKDLPVGLQLK